MTDTSHILYMDLYGFSYKIILLSVFIIKIEKIKKQNICFRLNIFCLLNISLSMHFGKSGRRCKSLQCWMMTCVDMERGVLFFYYQGLVVVVYFYNISLQKRK